MGMQKLAGSFGSAAPVGWWLRLSYRRPFPPWSKLRRSARAFLERVKEEAVRTRVAHRIHDNVEVEAIPRVGREAEMFHIAIMTDEDSGGWVLEELERNLRLCIEEKTEKVAAFRDRYAEWWLLFIDQVSYGLSEFDRAQFKKGVRISHSWDRVILVNPLDHTHYFEL
jgi:hypothetical protein